MSTNSHSMTRLKSKSKSKSNSMSDLEYDLKKIFELRSEREKLYENIYKYQNIIATAIAEGRNMEVNSFSDDLKKLNLEKKNLDETIDKLYEKLIRKHSAEEIEAYTALQRNNAPSNTMLHGKRNRSKGKASRSKGKTPRSKGKASRSKRKRSRSKTCKK